MLVLGQGRQGTLAKAGKEVSLSSSLASESLKSREAMETGQGLWKTIFRNWVDGKKVRADANGGFAMFISLHVGLVIRSILVGDVVVGIMSEVGATISRTLWFMF